MAYTSAGEAANSLLPDLKLKFERYCVPGTQSINPAGWKFFLRSCPGLELSSEGIDKLYLEAIGQPEISKSSRMSMDAFLHALRAQSRASYPSSDPEQSFLAFVLNHILPHKLDDASLVAHAHALVGGVPPSRVAAAMAGGTSRSSSPARAGSATGAATPVAEQSRAAASPQPGARGSPAPHAGIIKPASPTPAAIAGTPAGSAFDRAEAVLAELQQAAARPAATFRSSSRSRSGLPTSSAVPGAANSAPTATGLSSDATASKSAAAASRPARTPAPALPTLSSFLAELRLEVFQPMLADMGVESVQDLEELTDADLNVLGIKQLQARRLRDGLLRLRRDLHMQTLARASGKLGPAAGDFTGISDSTTSMATASAPVQDRTPEKASEKPKLAADHRPASPASPIDTMKAAAAAAAMSGAPGRYDWEEYATADGFLYYHQPKTGATQWLRPSSDSVRTIAIRAAEQAAIASVVEARIGAALDKQRVSSNHASPVDFNMVKQAAAIAAAAAASTSPTRHMLEEAIARAAAEKPRASSQNGLAQIPAPAPNAAATRGPATQPPRPDLPPASERLPWPERQAMKENAWKSAWSEVLQPDQTSPSPSVRTGPLIFSAAPSDARSHSPASAAMRAHAMLTSGLSPKEMVDERAANGVVGDAQEPGSYLKSYLNNRAGVQVSNGTDSGGVHRFGVTLASPRPPQSQEAGGLYRAPSARAMSAESPNHGEASGLYRAASWRLRTPAAGRGSRSPSAGARAAEALDALEVVSELTASSATEMYPEVYQSMPTMDEKTFQAIARAHSVANPRRMGYADPRPDVRPLNMLKAGAGELPPELTAGALEVPTVATGAAGKATSVFASMLRPHLYSPRADSQAPRGGAEMKRAWASGGLAPSEAASGYAYRHAAASSMFAQAGDVFDRLTDARGYTGTHRHRFADDGRGLGLAGRENSYDYKYLINSVETASNTVAAMPAPSALVDHSAGAGKK